MGNYNNPNPDVSGMKGWISSPGYEPRLAEVLSEDGWNREWVAYIPTQKKVAINRS